MSKDKTIERDVRSLAGLEHDQVEVSDDQLERLSELSELISSKIRDLLVRRNYQQKAAHGADAGIDYRTDQQFIDWLKKTYDVRRRRNQLLGSSDLFSEPAWDMILDLAYHQLHAKPISVKAACISSHVPASTALRYLSKMEQDGILVRVKDQADRRREFVVLTNAFMAKLHRFVSSVR